jgi:hypothetical protein
MADAWINRPVAGYRCQLVPVSASGLSRAPTRWPQLATFKRYREELFAQGAAGGVPVPAFFRASDVAVRAGNSQFKGSALSDAAFGTRSASRVP